MNMEKVDIIVIGAGVVGLAVASEVADPGNSVFVIEKNFSFGQETSSRNSEVIHAGIYYEKDSLKAKLCVEGNRLLYDICLKNNIPYKQTGKIIVAVDDNEIQQLHSILKKGNNNNVPGLCMLSSEKIKVVEPNIKAKAAIYSKTTGIIDTHKLMEHYIFKLKQRGADVVYNSEVVGIAKGNDGYVLRIKDASGSLSDFEVATVINSAGLDSDKIAQMAGFDIDALGYRLKYCKGHYYRVANSAKCKMINGLVYPVPQMAKGGLGIHATVDLSQSVRLGPDTKYLTNNLIDYDIDFSRRKDFFESAVKFMPFLEEDDLLPDMAGIRPKLQGEDEGFRDFVIKEERDNGFPGFINLIGIESPGLTASAAIAKYVKKMIN